MNNDEITKKDINLRSDLENLMYKKLTPSEQDIVRSYINFLENQIASLKNNKRDKEYYREEYKKQIEEAYGLKETIENLRKKYNYVCEKGAQKEIELDIANAKILKLEKGMKI